MSVDAAVPTDNDRSGMKPTPTVVFRKTYNGEGHPVKPSHEELQRAFDIITQKYGSWVLTTGFDRLGNIPGPCFYEAGEKAWKWMYDHSFYAQWSDEEWADWRAEWLWKRSYKHRWSEEEWRQRRAD